MVPTMSARDDSVLILHYHRRGRGVKVGDVVSYGHPLFLRVEAMKRIGGMPGDLVSKGGRMIQVWLYERLLSSNDKF